jgi:hypothetical protein
VVDDQGLHDLEMARTAAKLELGSHQRLKAALRKHRPRDAYYGRDLIEAALANHPGLTLEKALEDVEALGF